MNKTYKAIELEKFKGRMYLTDREFPKLAPSEALLKVHCATMHPADLAFLNGQYGWKQPKIFPIVPGLEGSGEIVEVGCESNKALIGKRASIPVNPNTEGTLHGVWAQYCIAPVDQLMIADFEIEYEKLCFAFVNPVTAVSFLDTLRKANLDSVVINGASSSFGKMFLKLCVQEKINVICIVRREVHFQDLLGMGAKAVFSTSNQNWETELRKSAEELKALMAFECVGGDFSGMVSSAMPAGSTIYHFGNLELKRLGSLDPDNFIKERKTFAGFNMGKWIMSLTPEEKQKWFAYVLNEFKSKSGIFDTKWSKDFPLKAYEEGIGYYVEHMNEGKILFRPFL